MNIIEKLEPSVVTRYLEQIGYNPYKNTLYEAKLDEWERWYKGYDETFHVKHISNGLNNVRKELYKLNMGKRVCEDWVSLTTLKDTKLVINSTNTKSSVFIQGSKGSTGVLGTNNFNTLFNTYLESMYALGTSAIVINISGAYKSGERLIGTKDTKIELTGYTAKEIYPISYKNGVISECAFSKRYTYNGKTIIAIQIHTLQNGYYKVESRFIDEAGNPVDPIGNVELLYNTNSKTPLFTIFKTAVANNIDINSPKGMSVYNSAIDNLKGVDICYNATIADVESGQRLVLMDRRLLSTDTQGNVIPPQDSKQYYFQFIGNELSTDENTIVKDFTPKLNTEELDKELNNQLALLGFKCGLGSNYYSFSNGVVTKTATEVLYSKKDERDNVDKQMQGIKEGIINIVKGILTIGSTLGIATVDTNAKITFEPNDGLINTDLEERTADREDVKLGLMEVWEYRTKWYGEDEATARKKSEELENKEKSKVDKIQSM